MNAAHKKKKKNTQKKHSKINNPQPHHIKRQVVTRPMKHARDAGRGAKNRVQACAANNNKQTCHKR